MPELHSLPRPDRVADLSEALEICGDIIASPETVEKTRDTLSRGMVTEYTVKISPAEFGCKVSIKTKQSRPTFEIKFMNGLNPEL